MAEDSFFRIFTQSIGETCIKHSKSNGEYIMPIPGDLIVVLRVLLHRSLLMK